MTSLSIITLILALSSLVAMFVPRLPAVIAAYAALVCAHFAGAVFVDAKILIYWGVAMAIVLGLRVLQPKALVLTGRGQAYVSLGTIVGVVLGYVVAPVVASLIIGGVVGAFLGAVAFMRTPAGGSMPVASGEFLQYLCAKGLPAVVTACMAAVAVSSML